MTIKALIEQERQRLQDLFDPFVGRGSWILLYRDGERQPFYNIAIDNFTVTRVKPRFDAEGNHTGTTFWAMPVRRSLGGGGWNGPGYDESFHHTHTIIVERMEAPDTYVFVFHGNELRIHFELLFPDVTPPEKDLYDALMSWRKYKKTKPEHFAEVDRTLLEEHQENANTWPEN